MIERKLTIINKLGLHARAAAKLVRLATAYSSAIEVKTQCKTANGKSIMGLMMLAAAQGVEQFEADFFRSGQHAHVFGLAERCFFGFVLFYLFFACLVVRQRAFCDFAHFHGVIGIEESVFSQDDAACLDPFADG